MDGNLAFQNLVTVAVVFLRNLLLAIRHCIAVRFSNVIRKEKEVMRAPSISTRAANTTNEPSVIEWGEKLHRKNNHSNFHISIFRQCRGSSEFL